MTIINLPNHIKICLNLLEMAGFEAFVVGGCVRDSLLDKEPKDWDICTSALPEQVISQLSGDRWKVVPTGSAHGTVTAIWGGQKTEITTFRCDGQYIDHRRPEKVEFVKNLEFDLSRRDFTINAMAYNPNRGLIDLFGGQDDLASRLLRCVGDSVSRFSEDALRILRLFRFCAQLDFDSDASALRAAALCREDLRHISAERIFGELERLLVCKNPGKTLQNMCKSGVLQVIIPEISDLMGFNQHTPYHHLPVDLHTFKSIDSIDPSRILRLTMLMHDIAKPPCFTMDKNGVGHFKGHAELGAKMSEKILTRMRCDSDTIRRVSRLVAMHSGSIEPDEVTIKKLLSRLGDEVLRDLIAVKTADTKAKEPSMISKRLKSLKKCGDMLESILAQNPCVTLKDLAVAGDDLIALGIRGAEIGKTLRFLLEAVIEGQLENTKKALIDYLASD